jgi:Tfp pilus assembly protein PilN
MNELSIDGLTQRLDRLERENHWWRRIGVVVLIGVAAVVLMGQQRAQVVEAQRFLIRDPASGKARAALSLLQDGSVGLSIISLDGKSLSLSADAGEDNSWLALTGLQQSSFKIGVARSSGKPRERAL